jgi:hypothetical protein
MNRFAMILQGLLAAMNIAAQDVVPSHAESPG